MICNIAAYHFVALDVTELPLLRAIFKQRCTELCLLGSILLSQEGINLFLAGEACNIVSFQAELQKDDRFTDIIYKESWSEKLPFKRLLIKIKKEIITSGFPELHPINKPRAASIDPQMLDDRLNQNKDEWILLDTRNDYEISYGSFKDAIRLDIKHFREFKNAIDTLDPALKDKQIVTFCTGGIRCEKAALLLEKQGFKNVYQLDGGILNYFEKSKDAEHYDGQCFVFDERVALNKQLKPISNGS